MCELAMRKQVAATWEMAASALGDHSEEANLNEATLSQCMWTGTDNCLLEAMARAQTTAEISAVWFRGNQRS